MVDSSAPGTSVSPGGSAAAGSPQPAVVSWSVIATTSRPARAAASTRPAGVSVPSEAVEWVCRSMRIASILDDGLDHSDVGTSANSGLLTDGPLAASGPLCLDHREPFGLLRFVTEHEFRNRVVERFRLGQVGDLVQRLDLTGGLDDHRAVAHHPARHRALIGEVGDLAQGH